MTIKAAPGIYLIEPIKEPAGLNYGAPKDKKILKGKIIAVGEDRQHDSGGELKLTLKVGTVVWFLNYSEGYDLFEEGGKKYYAVIGNDVRAFVE